LEKRRRRKGEKRTLTDSSEKAKTESKNRENTTHKKTVMGTCKNNVEEEPQPEAGNIVGKEMKKKKRE
jgi:hypothetical protein